jgi:hypothetical protein
MGSRGGQLQINGDHIYNWQQFSGVICGGWRPAMASELKNDEGG